MPQKKPYPVKPRAKKPKLIGYKKSIGDSDVRKHKARPVGTINNPDKGTNPGGIKGRTFTKGTATAKTASMKWKKTVGTVTKGSNFTKSTRTPRPGLFQNKGRPVMTAKKKKIAQVTRKQFKR